MRSTASWLAAGPGHEACIAAQVGTAGALGTGEGEAIGLELGLGLELGDGLGDGLAEGIGLEWLELGWEARGPLAEQPVTATRRQTRATPVLTVEINEQRCVDVTNARTACTAPRICPFTDHV
jgi:hypothetical protein